MKHVREKKNQNLSKNSAEQTVYYLNEDTMFLSIRCYVYIMHCFTHILVMVQLSGISPQRELKTNFLSFRENACAS